MKKVSLLCLNLLISLSAYAESDSDYFYQPEASKFTLLAALGKTSFKQKNYTLNSESEVSGDMTIFNYGAYYGLDSNNAIGILTSFQSIEAKSSTAQNSISGTDDIDLVYNGKMDWLRYSARFGYSPEKIKYDSNNMRANLVSGGMSAGISVGALLNTESFNYFANVKYSYLFDRFYENSSKKAQGGNSMSVALGAEYYYGHGFIVASYSYSKSEDSKNTVNSVISKGYSSDTVALEASYKVSESLSLLSTVGMVFVPEHNDDNQGNAVRYYSNLVYAAGFRYAF